MRETDCQATEMSEPAMADLRFQSKGMAWYCAKTTYKSVDVGVVRKRHLWERKFILIQGPRNLNPASLVPLVESIAREKEHEYTAISGNQVRWVFQEVEEIKELDDPVIKEGSEVYWEFFERVDKTASCVTDTG
jgi:hypothetical protein